MEKPFTYPIYQQGKRYYQQNKFREVKVNNNIIEGYVLDGNAYHVKLVFNSAKQLTTKKCDCSYAKFYHECKHMAALYMKVVDDKILDRGPTKLRDIYDLYVGNKARPLAKNYSDFEYKLKLELYKYKINGQIDVIKSYCNEFSNLNYPSARKDIIIMYFQDIFNELLTKEDEKENIYNWIYQCLIDDKNDFLHDYFIRIIQTREDKIEVINRLLNNEKLQLNSTLVSKLLLIVYESLDIEFNEFMDKYFMFKNTDVMSYLYTKEKFQQKDFSEVIHQYEDFINKYPFSSLKKLMSNLYDKSIFGHSPEKYVEKYLAKINYWTKDFTELSKIKKVLGNEWINIRDKFYDEVSSKVHGSTFENLIVDQNEWEVALRYLYEDPCYSNLRAYLNLILNNDEAFGYSAFFEYVVNLCQIARNESDINYIIGLLEHFYGQTGNGKVFDHMVYHLRQLFSHSSKLVEALDDMEESYED